MAYLLGKLPAQRPYGLSDLEVYVQGKMPAVPAEIMYGTKIPQTKWGMMLNNELGCCAISGRGHLTMLWNAETNENDHVPTDSEIDSTYMGLTGGVDSGLVLANVLHVAATTGLWGDVDEGYAPFDHSSILALHQSIAFFGGAYLGIACPQSMQIDFAKGRPITYQPGSPIKGGHCIIAIGYDQTYVDIVTWGKRVRVTYPFLSAYLDEGYAIIPHQFVEAGRGPKIDLVSLKRDIAALG